LIRRLSPCDSRPARWRTRAACQRAIPESVTDTTATAEQTPTRERAYRVRLYPEPRQARSLRRVFGARRFVSNWALRRKDEAWRADGTRLNGTALSRAFTALRQAPDTAWLSELPREPFNQTLRDFDRAWANFFAGRAKRPRRKRFGTVNSARFTLDQRRDGLVAIDGKHGSVQLDGIGRVKFRVTESMPGRLRSVTVSCDAAGRWHASFTADRVPMPAMTPAARTAVGVDLGLKDAAALSTGQVIAAHRALAKKLKGLRRHQRAYARGRAAAMRAIGLDPKKRIPKGARLPVSSRMRRTKHRIGVLHARVADSRRDFQHQLSRQLVATAEVICLEDLAVKAMQRGMGHRAFRRGVSDAGMGALRRCLEYKAAWHGRIVSVVDRFYPSSKTCSACGAINADLTLRDRRWACPACGVEHHRDLNAAVNIEREGLRRLAGSTCPDGPTPRSGGRKARGADACAAGRSSPAGQPTAVKREQGYRAAQRRPRTGARDGPRGTVREG
jgi:putative transposase